MDFQSAMETFAEAWVAANTKGSFSDIGTQSQALALTRGCKTPPSMSATNGPSGIQGSGSGVHCDSPTERLHSSPPPTSHHDTPHHDSESIVSPPPSRTLKEGFDLSKTASGKSLPVHCVVEAICTLEEPFAHQQSHAAWRRRPVIETDSYVIIPVNTIFHELVQVALQRLGYSSDSASAARGSVVIKNWKPLSFDKIADGPLVTVGDILGELTTVATLRIQVYRARPSALNDIKDKLLRLLLIQSHGLLLSTGCPLDEIILSQICRGNGVSHRVPEPSEESRRKFDQWWSAQVAPPGHGVHAHPPGRPQSAMQYSPGAGGTCIPSPQKALERSPSLSALAEHVHPALQTVQNQYPTQKTRMRTSFDPELELPKLQNWFAENQHPSRQQIQQYVKELNSLESRRGRKPLDVNNVVYWFKNARAAQKRAETRGIGPCHLGVNGYTSSSHSPPNGTGLLLTPESYLHQDRLNDHHLKSPMPTNVGHNAHNMSTISEDISNAGSDLEEDDPMEEHRSDEEQPQSPNVPLSLTTTRKNDDRDNMHQSPQHSSPPDMIKEEPKDDPAPVRSPPMSSNNNNNHKDGGISDIEEDDLDDTDRNEDPDERKKSRTDDEPLYRMDLRPPLRNFRSPTPEIDGALIPRGPGSGNLDRIATAGFPLVPNSMFSHSIMYMSHYIPGLSHAGHTNMASTSPPGSSGLSMSALAASTADERRKRNRTFIDPVTEVPRLEHWFSLSTHPSHNLILKYTEELNRMPYRQKFPRLEPKNVQFWFKNRRAKCKRLKMALFDNPPSAGHAQYHHSDRD